MLSGIRCRTALGCSLRVVLLVWKRSLKSSGMGMLLGSRIATPSFEGAFRCLPWMAFPDGALDVVVRGGLRTG